MRVFKFIIVVFFTLFFMQCSKNKHLVEKDRVGIITANTKVNELLELFKKDSLVSNLASEENKSSYFFNSDEYVVYNKNGKKLLVITPIESNDSVSKIKSIQLFDTSYKTEKGLSLSSTFKEIAQNYKINKVEATLTSAMLFIDELNATIALDKEDLGISPFSKEDITLSQIPDNAKIKYFTVWFN